MKQALSVAVLVVTLVCSAFSAHAQSPQMPSWADATGPVKPGTVRVTLPPPDKDKWATQVADNGATRIFRCKPLACAEQETVYVYYRKSPTAHPDPKALERFATVDLPKNIRAALASRSIISDQKETLATLVSKTATIKEYPGVVNESKITKAKDRPNFYATNVIFAGPLMIKVEAISPDRATANRTLKEFIDAMIIVQGPPAPAPQPPRKTTPGLQEL